MEFDNKEMSKYLTIFALIIAGVLVFFLIRPVAISIISGLILAYICLPIYKKLLQWTKNKTLSVSIILIVLILIVLVPLWFLLPVLLEQTFKIYQMLQTMDISSIVHSILPTASQQTIAQISISVQSVISKATSAVVGSESPINIFFQLPTMLINLFIGGFVFFFSLRDSDKLIALVKEVSPLSKTKEKLFIQQFKDVTDSIVFGQIISGLVQGLLAGLGLLIFGVDHVLVLTALAIVLSIIPVLGPYIIYIPVAIFLIVTGHAGTGLLYLLYNIAIVSTVDNFLRTYIVAKKTKMNSAIVFVGMMAGLFVFGFVGLLIGPLILAYFLLLLQLYKDKSLQNLFMKEEPVEVHKQ